MRGTKGFCSVERPRLGRGKKAPKSVGIGVAKPPGLGCLGAAAAAAAPKQPSPGGFATPIPTDLGAFFPRPKRGRSTEQKPLVPRTEF